MTTTTTSQQIQVSTAAKSTARRRDERGMTTAEYAVGTVGAVTAAGVLVTIFSQEWFRDLLIFIIKAIIELATGIKL